MKEKEREGRYFPLKYFSNIQPHDDLCTKKKSGITTSMARTSPTKNIAGEKASTVSTLLHPASHLTPQPHSLSLAVSSHLSPPTHLPLPFLFPPHARASTASIHPTPPHPLVVSCWVCVTNKGSPAKQQRSTNPKTDKINQGHSFI